MSERNARQVEGLNRLTRRYPELNDPTIVGEVAAVLYRFKPFFGDWIITEPGAVRLACRYVLAKRRWAKRRPLRGRFR